MEKIAKIEKNKKMRNQIANTSVGRSLAKSGSADEICLTSYGIAIIGHHTHAYFEAVRIFGHIAFFKKYETSKKGTLKFTGLVMSSKSALETLRNCRMA